MPSPVPPVMKFCSTALVTAPAAVSLPRDDVHAAAGPAPRDRVLEQVGAAVGLDQHAGVAVGDRVVGQPDRLVAGEVLPGEPLEADVGPVHRVAGVGDGGGGAGVRGDAEGPLQVESPGCCRPPGSGTGCC